MKPPQHVFVCLFVCLHTDKFAHDLKGGICAPVFLGMCGRVVKCISDLCRVKPGRFEGDDFILYESMI